MEISMNYKKLYDALVLDAINNPKEEEYKELHHIIPKCLGGSDSEENLVLFTARQHFLAHWLLFKLYKTSKLAYAWRSMRMVGKGQERRKVNSKAFSIIKKSTRSAVSKALSGSGNPFFGKSHSEKTKMIISSVNSGRTKSESEITNWVDKVARKPKSEEHKRKIGKSGMAMLQNIKTLEIIRVDKTDERFGSTEWINPRKLKPEEKFECCHCGKITNKGNLQRWHGDNCKKKGIL